MQATRHESDGHRPDAAALRPPGGALLRRGRRQLLPGRCMVLLAMLAWVFSPNSLYAYVASASAVEDAPSEGSDVKVEAVEARRRPVAPGRHAPPVVHAPAVRPDFNQRTDVSRQRPALARSAGAFGTGFCHPILT